MDLQEIIFIIFTLIYLEGILSIDNAAVLAAMANQLPDDKPVPWPALLKPYTRSLNAFLGSQRTAALKVGLLGAYFGRALMLLIANYIVHNPWLKALGALYLIKLGLEGLSVAPSREEEKQSKIASTDFWTVVAAIELADLAFSLDNVVAAVAISSNITIVMIGVAIGIITMRFAAGIFTKLISIEPSLTRAAYLLLLLIAGELFAHEFLDIEISETTRLLLSLGTIAIAILYSRFLSKTILRPLVTSFGVGFYYLNELVNTVFAPLALVSKSVAKKTYHSSKGILAAFWIALGAIEKRLRRR